MIQQQDTMGILYVATGEKYIRAAIRSAESARKYCPNIPIHLFADWQNYEFNFGKTHIHLSNISQIDQPHPRSKVDYLSQTPFDCTLYLDTDTLINSDISGMFQILERFDIAMAHAHHRNSKASFSQWRMDVPHVFPQFNSGVVLYRKTPAVVGLFEEWSSAYKAAGFKHDQTTLRELLWLSNLRIATLPPEYNLRYIK